MKSLPRTDCTCKSEFFSLRTARHSVHGQAVFVGRDVVSGRVFKCDDTGAKRCGRRRNVATYFLFGCVMCSIEVELEFSSRNVQERQR
ncbi:hypothetical protein T4D_5241 [Trichinella pseudospiralis]|uniref:Uncharacterized protein n=1 Tax=Trichinella pseudospiralis TaxID=6337 RepID=A0A0V1FMG5_TRIPS|nr:hypothetical protein T4D_5241 [Trichinella pseudospiralis]